MEDLRTFLRAARKSRNLSLREVEAQTGISNAYLSQLEGKKTRRPSPEILHKLADLYGVPYPELLSLAGHPLPSDPPDADPAALFARALGPLTPNEEEELLEYLAFIRARRRR